MLDQLTLDQFTPYLGHTFHLHPGGDQPPLPLELVEATALGHTTARAFALVFRGAAQPVLPQRIYHITHDQMGALDVFLVPIGLDNTGLRYEVIFT